MKTTNHLNLTKGKIRKLYKKKRQTLKKRKNGKRKSGISQKKGMNSLNLSHKTLKNMKGGDMFGGVLGWLTGKKSTAKSNNLNHPMTNSSFSINPLHQSSISPSNNSPIAPSSTHNPILPSINSFEPASSSSLISPLTDDKQTKMNAVIQELRDKLNSENKLQDSEMIPENVEPSIPISNPFESNVSVSTNENENVPVPNVNLGTEEEKVNTGLAPLPEALQEPLKEPLPVQEQAQEPLPSPLPITQPEQEPVPLPITQPEQEPAPLTLPEQEPVPLEEPLTFKRLDEKVPSDRATVGDDTEYSEVITSSPQENYMENEEKNTSNIETPHPSTELLESLNDDTTSHQVTVGESENNETLPPTPINEPSNNLMSEQNPVPPIPAIDSEPEPELQPENTMKSVNQVTPSEPVNDEPIKEQTNVVTPVAELPQELEEPPINVVTPPIELEEPPINVVTPVTELPQELEEPSVNVVTPPLEQEEEPEYNSQMPVSVSNSFQTIIDYVSTNIANKLAGLFGSNHYGQDQFEDVQNGFIANNINNRTMGSQGGKTRRHKLYRSKKRTYRKQ